MSAARRGLRDRTSLRSNHFAAFCIQQCFAAFVARGLLLTSARAETIRTIPLEAIFHDSCEPDGVGGSSEPALLLSRRMTGLTAENLSKLSVPGELEGLATIFVSRLDRRSRHSLGRIFWSLILAGGRVVKFDALYEIWPYPELLNRTHANHDGPP